jgi:phospholipid/cholesterol/gamma-HCH transport system substrate-binding protein
VNRRLPTLVAAVALLGASTGCNGVFGVDLPGGSAHGPTYHVTVLFDDVLDLVPQSAVKVDDVSVGDVDSITLDPGSFKAKVRLTIRKSVHLPGNAVARVRQTSLLGEKFVELAPPTEAAPEGELRDGGIIDSEHSSRTPEVEEVFTALSALLNGGGIGNLQTIAVELSSALSGREATVRSSLRNITKMVTAFDQRKGDIVRAIDALDHLTKTLADQRQTIGEALDTFTPALTVLADQRAELTRLLTHLSRLGAVGSHVINASRADTVETLRLLAPILDKVVSARTDLSKALDQVLLLTKLVPRAIPGDYLQLYVELFLDPTKLPPVDAAAAKRLASAAAASAARLPVTAPDTGSALDLLVRRGVTP